MDPHALRVLEYDRFREVLIAYATTALGRRAIARLAPLPDASAVRKALAEVEELRRFTRTFRVPLAGVSEVAPAIRGLADGGMPAEPSILLSALSLLRAAEAVRAAFERDPGSFPRLAELGGRIECLPMLRHRIEGEIDPRGDVKDDATPRLKALRSEIAMRRESLRIRAATKLADPRIRKALQSEGVTVKDDRYLLPVKADYRSWVHGVIRDRSQSGSTLYIEPDDTVLDGDALLDLIDDERKEMEVILWELTRAVLAEEPRLGRMEAVLGDVDLASAKAAFAEAFGCSAPEISEEFSLDLKEARHPYLLWLRRDTSRDVRSVDLEAARRDVVPLDVRLGGRAAILIITGPNTGGKTVALKTIGLLCLLALSGVPVPAAPGSRVPLLTDLFADIGDEQSLEQSLSTFSSHLSQIVEVLRRADPRSLILLDELGAGTDPLEGAALGTSLLDAFRDRGWHAIITTHIGSLKEYAFENEGAENAAMEFDPSTLRPTYRLILGTPGRSNALAIARRMGLDPQVVEAAEAKVARGLEPTEHLVARMERSARRAEKERRRAERIRRRAQGAARAVEETRAEVVAERDALRREAEEEVDLRVREARDRLRPLLQKMKSVPPPLVPVVEEMGRTVEEALSLTPLGVKREEFARSLKKDDEVYVPKFRERCRVKKINKGERLLTVLLNGIPMEIGFDDVTWVE
jgi:DNA mismatch repair protein MutS2